MELDSIAGILAMVERGLGVAIIPESAVWEWPSSLRARSAGLIVNV
jgi:DNA-binding transcriptional LysR family regulator